MTTYIKDLIDLPEKVHGGDFVLKLTEGVEHPEQTLKPYVVTPQLGECFDAALDFIKGAVQANSSKAAYLHGSFGSGKSHFMAVLHLLLQQEPAARAKEGLEAVVTEHNAWLEGKKFLLVPYHMIGKASMEEAVLGGYVKRVLELHPDAPIPGVYKAEGLFRDASKMRERMGDAAFFEQLNQSASSAGEGGGWGELEAAWDAPAFEVALEAPPGSDERARLIGALVEEFFQSYKDVARGNQEAFVSLDDGLAIISRHAQTLGYDALVLFLDELILWLATHAADQAFLNTEGPKVSKLVEAENADRPIPIVSFVARQRDLKELVGESVTGAEQMGFADVLRWWEARFDQITLEDRNLPEIAARRVLLPKSEAARQQFDHSWEETQKIRESVLDILLTPKSDRRAFRKVYPFSPALVETLVAVSSVLQRERTALKVMLQLLVDQRDTLELGQIVPVGDLFDVIAHGDEPFTELMRIHFENAKSLYQQKLRPMLEREHGVTEEEIEGLPHNDPKARAFRADGRLLKTLLLSALVPEVEVLKGLNSERLSALNHGSVSSPIAGREKQEVLRRLRNWASQVGEIKIGEESDPIINVQLSGVDTEAILENAKVSDNPGNRRRKIRELLFEQLGIEDVDEMFISHDMTWRGDRFRFQVIFANVRELTTESLAAKADSRKAILDFPFDEAGHSPSEDIKRLDDFRQSEKPSRTLAWLPSFLSAKAQKELGMLVRLEEALKSDDSFRRHANHLSDFDRTQARVLLDNQRTQLRQAMIRYLEGAYGVDKPAEGSIDESHSPAEHFQSLDPSYTPQPPVGANMRAAFEHLLSQMLESQFPAHPEFDAEVKIGSLRKVQDEVSRATQISDGRVDIPQPLRGLMHAIAVPLKLGEMGETHFVLDRYWYNHFNREVDGGELTVGKLRAVIDEPSPMGLTRSAEDLVIMLYADQTNRSFVLHGGPYRPKLDDLPDELELREQALPAQEIWEEALLRAGKVFGITISPLLNANNLSDLVTQLDENVRPNLEACQGLKDRLDSACADYGIDPSGCDRLETASAVLLLIRSLVTSSEDGLAEVLAGADVSTSLDAMATSYRKAGGVHGALETAKWNLFEAVSGLTDDRSKAAAGHRARLVEALSHDEYAIALGEKLKKLEDDAIRLLTPPETTQPTPTPPKGVQVVETKSQEGLAALEAREVLARLASRLEEESDLRLDVSWTLTKVSSSAEKKK